MATFRSSQSLQRSLVAGDIVQINGYRFDCTGRSLAYTATSGARLPFHLVVGEFLGSLGITEDTFYSLASSIFEVPESRMDNNGMVIAPSSEMLTEFVRTLFFFAEDKLIESPDNKNKGRVNVEIQNGNTIFTVADIVLEVYGEPLYVIE